MIWDNETIQRLKALWALGTPTAEIGRRLGVSKNAIVGKAHRLDLEPRPSPIRSEHCRLTAPVYVPRLRPTLPPLPSETAAATPVMLVLATVQRPDPVVLPIQQIIASDNPPGPIPMPVPVPRAVTPPVPPKPLAVQRPIVRRPAKECCWPIGEPGNKAFRFCDAPSLPGKPYCDEHSKLAYVRVRDRKEDAV